MPSTVGLIMIIIRISKVDHRNVVLVVADHGGRQRVVHQLTGYVQPLNRNGWDICCQVSDPFVMDLLCPAGLDQSIRRHLDENIPEMEWI